MQRSTLVVAIVLLIVAFPGGTRSQGDFIEMEPEPIYCFQCNSREDKDCTTLQANQTESKYYKPCIEYHGAAPFCRKIVQTIFERDNMVRVIRKCGWEKHPRLDCYYMNNDDHTETVCQCFSNGCNDAVRTSLAVSTLAATLGVAFILVS